MVSPSQPACSPRVLIVDESSDSREVLSLALRLRGLRTVEAAGRPAGLQLARQFHPDLIVLDDETDAPAGLSSCQGFAEYLRQDNTPLIVLGGPRLAPSGPRDMAVVSKPYHYGPLIRKIEELLHKCSAPASDASDA